MSPPADAKRSPPGPGTATSRPLSAPPPCRQPDSATPTWAPSTDASPPAAETSEPSSRSNGQSSPPSGTCPATGPGTYYQDPGPDHYSSHDPTKHAARAVSASEPSATRSTSHLPSLGHARRRPLGERDLRGPGAQRDDHVA